MSEPARARPLSLGSAGTLTLVLLVAWILVGLVSLGLGAVHLPADKIAGAILAKVPLPGFAAWAPDWPASYDVILFRIRLPRVILAGLVGASLALAGTVMQGLFRNPMADPYVLGTSSGAALGAVLALVLPLDVSLFGLRTLPLVAFAGALGTTALVYAVARVPGGMPTATLLLAGIAVSSFLSALVSLVLVFNEQSVANVLYWLMGGLSRADWTGVALVLPYVLAGAAVALACGRRLNALLLGEEAAWHLGIDVERMKRLLLFATALLTAAAVAVSGVIGFVGLVVPHMTRLVVGPDHRRLVPAAALVGAIFLTTVDAVARTALGATEIPAGAITAILGGPFFLFLLRRRRREHGGSRAV